MGERRVTAENSWTECTKRLLFAGNEKSSLLTSVYFPYWASVTTGEYILISGYRRASLIGFGLSLVVKGWHCSCTYFNIKCAEIPPLIDT